jgi:hypothetical protein
MPLGNSSPKAVQVALDRPEAHLSGDMLRQFHIARSADSVSQTLDEDELTKTFSAVFKLAVKTRLQRDCVSFHSEGDQRQQQKRGAGNQPTHPTPDFLIHDDFKFVIGCADVRWIEDYW